MSAKGEGGEATPPNRQNPQLRFSNPSLSGQLRLVKENFINICVDLCNYGQLSIWYDLIFAPELNLKLYMMIKQPKHAIIFHLPLWHGDTVDKWPRPKSKMWSIMYIGQVIWGSIQICTVEKSIHYNCFWVCESVWISVQCTMQVIWGIIESGTWLPRPQSAPVTNTTTSNHFHFFLYTLTFVFFAFTFFVICYS